MSPPSQLLIQKGGWGFARLRERISTQYFALRQRVQRCCKKHARKVRKYAGVHSVVYVLRQLAITVELPLGTLPQHTKYTDHEF